MDEQVNATQRISAILSHGAKGEANTNKDYFNDLAEILTLAESAGLTEEQIDTIISNYEEIIADELNHSQRFNDLLTMVSGIEANKDKGGGAYGRRNYNARQNARRAVNARAFFVGRKRRFEDKPRFNFGTFKRAYQLQKRRHGQAISRCRKSINRDERGR